MLFDCEGGSITVQTAMSGYATNLYKIVQTNVAVFFHALV
jgi:hypothetical protein